MEVVNSIPVELDEEEVLRSIAVGRLRDKGNEIVSLVERSRQLIDPRAVYTSCGL